MSEKSEEGANVGADELRYYNDLRIALVTTLNEYLLVEFGYRPVIAALSGTLGEIIFQMPEDVRPKAQHSVNRMIEMFLERPRERAS